jgi:hypothetical protein
MLPETVSMSDGITHMKSQNEMTLPEAESSRNEFVFAFHNKVFPEINLEFDINCTMVFLKLKLVDLDLRLPGPQLSLPPVPSSSFANTDTRNLSGNRKS